ncbi:hypothetical protein PHYSODRAFT_288652 [Phytophthora sojae]|uniref:Uncharacterized protein n=1 Tax=Phytophthora sojae (strain P6497) TaxID=1094619 RepID=G5A6H2_PHYSP|nr:hypothetical protein PHYSODRAFT_288652 [Phytophthora sojae]EGZ08927.1 hypothetical protein PHYSODRAFT_288652 [Phytophthora sojae]|eukprot:XP_009535560.1 hypothetical protein PHYSODRAFT_288652 [Phytophthora sojae]
MACQDPLAGTLTPRGATEQRVLLSFLDELDVTDLGVCAGGKQRSPKRAVDTTRPKSANVWWKRKKNELEKLRAESKARETQLTLLQTGELETNAIELSQDQPSWKDAAEVEKQRCQVAQTENERLKMRIKGCLQICGSLQSALSLADTSHCEMETLVAWALQAERKTTVGTLTSDT